MSNKEMYVELIILCSNNVISCLDWTISGCKMNLSIDIAFSRKEHSIKCEYAYKLLMNVIDEKLTVREYLNILKDNA